LNTVVITRPGTNAAVDATAGKVVLYEGEVAKTFFFSTSGGRTASAEDVWGEAAIRAPGGPDEIARVAEDRLDTMRATDGHRAHFTHIQFHSYGGGDEDEDRDEGLEPPHADPCFRVTHNATTHSNGATSTTASSRASMGRVL
jgi:peptidoglycan hydrolase-like amidase